MTYSVTVSLSSSTAVLMMPVELLMVKVAGVEAGEIEVTLYSIIALAPTHQTQDYATQ